MSFARGAIDADAERVVRRLARAGYQAYLVGGCVRDILLEREPKDFDVATSATPNEIKQLFRNCRIIGRRFRLAHVFFGTKIIETSTFRANPRPEDLGEESELLIRRDNVFGSDTEDARRRDFTINGLFYDVEEDSVIDHVGGLADLDARLVRTIGDPEIRFQEDPVRMLRAIKFAARLGFDIEAETYRALTLHRDEIRKCAAPRVIEELYRLLRGGAARRSMELLLKTGVAEVLSPQLASMFALTGATSGSRRADATGHPRDSVGHDQAPAQTDPDDGYADEIEERPEDPEEAAWRAVWLDEQPRQKIKGPSPKFLEPDKLDDQRSAAWKVLDEIDGLASRRAELDNAILLALLIHPFVADAIIAPRTTPGQATAMILETCQPLIEQLRVARRDSEKIRQVLLAQRRLDPARRRRGRPSSLAGREFFDDALTLYEISGRARGIDVAEVAAMRPAGEPSSDDNGEFGARKRRRRRGGRRRRRGEEDDIYEEAGLGAESDEQSRADDDHGDHDDHGDGDDHRDDDDEVSSKPSARADGVASGEAAIVEARPSRDDSPRSPRPRARRRRSRRIASAAADDDAKR